MTKEIKLANPRGFCAGVDRAIDIVNKALDIYGAPVYVKHEVVHNKVVVDDLRNRGAVFVVEIDEIPDDSLVIFSAHGVSSEVEETTKARNLNFFDATCPLVTKVHMEVRKHAKANRDIILIGHEGHPEVEGTMGRHINSKNSSIYLVQDENDALNNSNPLPNNYTNISNPQTIYARVEDTNAFECYSTTSFDLVVCLIPEGISPNNDGYNDTFELKGYDVKSLKVYNRYGKLVYSTTNYADNWEGQSNEGNKLPVGTYFYHIIYDENLEKTGWVYINY